VVGGENKVLIKTEQRRAVRYWENIEPKNSINGAKNVYYNQNLKSCITNFVFIIKAQQMRNYKFIEY
jgi:hypothetical protein